MSNARFIYVIGVSNSPVKIGVADRVNQRLSNLQIGCPDELVIHHQFRTIYKLAQKTEAEVHRRLSGKHRRGEWFDITADEARETILSVLADIEAEHEATPPPPGFVDFSRPKEIGAHPYAKEAIAWYRTAASETASLKVVEAINARIVKEAGKAAHLAFRTEIMSHSPLTQVLARNPVELKRAQAALVKAVNVLADVFLARREQWLLDKIRGIAA